MEVVLIVIMVVLAYFGPQLFPKLLDWRTPRLPESEAAFDEKIEVSPTDGEQLSRLKPLVVQVGIVTVGSLEPREGHDLRSYAGAHHYDDGDEWEIYVVDSLGTIHVISTTRERAELSKTVQALVVGLDAELVDPDGILR